jgi:hypothetical protein
MNDIPSPRGTTRRSFIKRSVVAAVAVSSMTILSGLVKAIGEGSEYTCQFWSEDEWEWDPETNTPKVVLVYCWYKNAEGCNETESCYAYFDEDGNPCDQRTKVVDCRFNVSKATSVVCDTLVGIL